MTPPHQILMYLMKTSWKPHLNLIYIAWRCHVWHIKTSFKKNSWKSLISFLTLSKPVETPWNLCSINIITKHLLITFSKHLQNFLERFPTLYKIIPHTISTVIQPFQHFLSILSTAFNFFKNLSTISEQFQNLVNNF